MSFPCQKMKITCFLKRHNVDNFGEDVDKPLIPCGFRDKLALPLKCIKKLSSAQLASKTLIFCHEPHCDNFKKSAKHLFMDLW